MFPASMKRCSGPVLFLAVLGFASAGTLHIDPKARIHPTAVLMGNVTVGAYTEVGPKVVIAGDITIGNHVNILGNAVIEADKASIGNYVRIDYGARLLQGRQTIPNITANSRPDELYVRDNCWIGMNATVRGARLEDGSSVGNGAVAEFNTHLERGAILAHGAISAFDMVIPANSLAEGNPAIVTKRAAIDADRDTLLAERYERGSVLISSNLPFSKWEGIFKDPMTTAAAIDRLVHHCVILELNIPSYRVEQAKKAKQETLAE
jgi:carbonic anhydrase/acetyltransferase-like protein (isoleucine patch superfamily)